MPVLKRFPDCRIAIYPRDHLPAHVHIEFRDGSRVTVEIETLRVTGTIRPLGRLARPLAWVAGNQPLLRARWKEIVR